MTFIVFRDPCINGVDGTERRVRGCGVWISAGANVCIFSSAVGNASAGGPHENPMNDAVDCSRKLERQVCCDGVVGLADALSADCGED